MESKESSVPSLHSFRTAHDGRDAGARDLDEAEWQHQGDELLDLVAGAGDLEYEAFGRGIDHSGAKCVGEPQGFNTVLPLPFHLDHRELALDRVAGKGHIDNVMHRNEPVQLILDLLDHHRRAGGYDRDQREMLPVLGLRHGQRLDIVAAAGKQADHACKHAGLVINQYRKRMRLRFLRRRRGRVVTCCGCVGVHQTITLPSSVMASSTATPASPSNISLCARPEGIIGKQFSLGSTTQSNSTGLSTVIISLMARSRSPGFSQRMPWA